jgi:hypothetical protein
VDLEFADGFRRFGHFVTDEGEDVLAMLAACWAREQDAAEAAFGVNFEVSAGGIMAMERAGWALGDDGAVGEAASFF